MKVRPSTWLAGIFFSVTFMSGCASQKTTTVSNASNTANTVTQTSSPAEHADLSGAWDYVMTNEQQEAITGVLTIQKGGSAGYTGRITTNEISLDSETNITKAQLNGSDFIYEGMIKAPDGDIAFAIKGTIQGNNMAGENNVLYQNRNVLWKVKATRK